MPDTPRSEVFLRLGSHSEKQYVLKTYHLFSGVLVGANLLESTPGATVSFALNVLNKQKSFAIDPMTYIAVCAGLTLAALLASYLPALRATLVNPVTARSRSS